MELKLFAEIHISFKRSNLHSDETKSEWLCIETGYEKKKTHEKDSFGIMFPLIRLSSHLPNRLTWLFCQFS